MSEVKITPVKIQSEGLSSVILPRVGEPRIRLPELRIPRVGSSRLRLPTIILPMLLNSSVVLYWDRLSRIILHRIKYPRVSPLGKITNHSGFA